MARVVIRVEAEGGSLVEITEVSAFPLHTDDRLALLTQEAYVRTLRALGVQPRPDPEPPAAAVIRPEPVPTPHMQKVADPAATEAKEAA